MTTDTMDFHEGLRQVPERYRGGMERYLAHGVRPGGALQAIIANDLMEAAVRIDEDMLISLPTIARFLHNYAPPMSYGNWNKLDAWCERGGITGERS